MGDWRYPPNSGYKPSMNFNLQCKGEPHRPSGVRDLEQQKDRQILLFLYKNEIFLLFINRSKVSPNKKIFF